MFNRELVFAVALILGSFLASAQGHTSTPPETGFGEENSSPSRTKRIKTTNNHPEYVTDGPQSTPAKGIQTADEDPEFLAALENLMMSIERTPRAHQLEQEVSDFDLACIVAADKASRDFVENRQPSRLNNVAKELFPIEPGSPAEPQLKRRAVS